MILGAGISYTPYPPQLQVTDRACMHLCFSEAEQWHRLLGERSFQVNVAKVMTVTMNLLSATLGCGNSRDLNVRARGIPSPGSGSPSRLWGSYMVRPGLGMWHLAKKSVLAWVQTGRNRAAQICSFLPCHVSHRWLSGAWPGLWCLRMTSALRTTSGGGWNG